MKNDIRVRASQPKSACYILILYMMLLNICYSFVFGMQTYRSLVKLELGIQYFLPRVYEDIHVFCVYA